MRAMLNLRGGGNPIQPLDSVSDIPAFISQPSANGEVYAFPFQDSVIAYLPYDQVAYHLEPEEWAYFTAHPQPGPDVPLPLLTSRLYSTPDRPSNEEMIDDFKPRDLTLFLGDACNLSCTYCNATSNRRHRFDVERTRETLKILLSRYPIDTVSFFGNGEPLLYFDAITCLTDLAQEYGITRFGVTTNGVLGRRRSEIVAYLVNNNFQVQLSIDGSPDIHDRSRPTNRGTGSFSEVLETLAEFRLHGVLSQRVTGRLTLTTESISHLSGTISFLTGLGLKKIKAAELVPEGAAAGATPPSQVLGVEASSRKISDALMLAEQLGVEFSSDFDPREPAGEYGCNYIEGSAIAVNASGQLLTCLEDVPNWVIGGVDAVGGVQLKPNAISRARGRRASKLPDCPTCPVKCGGGCAHFSNQTFGGLDTSGDHRAKCDILRSVLRNYLIQKFDDYAKTPERR